jgi:hypothetical protein
MISRPFPIFAVAAFKPPKEELMLWGYRDKAIEYEHRAVTAANELERLECQRLYHVFSQLAEKEEWMAEHKDQLVQPLKV